MIENRKYGVLSVIFVVWIVRWDSGGMCEVISEVINLWKNVQKVVIDKNAMNVGSFEVLNERIGWMKVWKLSFLWWIMTVLFGFYDKWYDKGILVGVWLFVARLLGFLNVWAFLKFLNGW